MSFTQYLKDKSTFLVIWFSIHAFAFFVNFFKINGQILKTPNGSDFIGGGYTYKTTNLFTSANKHYSSSNHNYTSDFWPFVNFFGKSSDNGFRGFFNNYNLPEFIFYSTVIFIILFFRYKAMNKKR
ncbi:hypothetical protein MG290_07450 [Flavobacterium sp. CBA20B-1]|uniref:hypothetical protein n=1 Tax=unclassified Flavobacterium TaxID=196869 RepID=UPI0022257F3A|nr:MULTISPECIES: hypothetical protein [unclassified Flavobacterium]WCM40813.1 hypothetical protein MG290_07450 [Flavobacterium sp. CBA20B-1]